MITQEVLIGYCKADKQVAQAIDNDLVTVTDNVAILEAESCSYDHPFWKKISEHQGSTLLLLSESFFYSTGAMFLAEQNMPVLVELGKVYPISVEAKVEQPENQPEFLKWSKQVKIKTFWEQLSAQTDRTERFNDNYTHQDIQRILKNIPFLLEFLAGQDLVSIHQIIEKGGISILRYLGSMADPLDMEQTSSFFRKEDNDHEPDIETPDISGIPGLELLERSTRQEEATDYTQEDIREEESESDPGMQPITPRNIKNKKESHLLDKLVQHRNEAQETSRPETSTETEGQLEELNDEIAERIEAEKSQAPSSKPRYVSNKNILRRVSSLLDQGHPNDAITLLETAVERHSTDIDLRYELGILYLENAQYFDAVNTFTELLPALPDNIPLLIHLAQAKEYIGDRKGAARHYQKVLEFDPKNSESLFRLAMLSKNFPDASPSEVASLFKRACKANRQNSIYRYQYGRFLYRFMGKEKKARRQLEKAIALQPDLEQAWFELANIYRDSGDSETANACLKRAASLRLSHHDLDFDQDPLFDREEEDEESGMVYDEVMKATSNKPMEKQPVDNKVEEIVLITGASSGIGRATAHAFAREGYPLILCARRTDRLDKLKAELEDQYGASIHNLVFDVRSKVKAEEALASLPNDWRSISILINNAGLASGLDPIHKGSIDDWEQMIDTNIKGLLYMTRLISPGMVKRKRGHIINLCSTAGKETYPKGNVYCATKHAVDALTKAMRLDLHTHNIKVSQVSPAHVEETEFARVRFHGDQEKARIYEDFNPLKSSDVAEAILFIATRPPWVNIQDILLMGTQQANSNFIHRVGRIFDEEE